LELSKKSCGPELAIFFPSIVFLAIMPIQTRQAARGRAQGARSNASSGRGRGRAGQNVQLNVALVPQNPAENVLAQQPANPIVEVHEHALIAQIPNHPNVPNLEAPDVQVVPNPISQPLNNVTPQAPAAPHISSPQAPVRGPHDPIRLHDYLTMEQFLQLQRIS